MPARTWVVVPNFNGEDYLAPCLDSLLAQDEPGGGVVVAVVDNGSSDGSVALVTSRYPAVRLLALERNTGFTGGCNRGIEAAMREGAEYVVLFNNDAIADPGFLRALVEDADANPGAYGFNGKVVALDGTTIHTTGDFYTTWGFPLARGENEPDTGQYDDPDDRWVFAVSGGASLLRVPALREVGVFDEDFFAYYEDVDLGFRAQLAGWTARYVPGAVARHRVGGTSTKIPDLIKYETTKNLVYVYVKNVPGLLFWKNLPRFVLGWTVRTLFAVVVRRDVKPVGAAVARIARDLPRTLRKRRHIQRCRKVSAAVIESRLQRGYPPVRSRLRGRARAKAAV